MNVSFRGACAALLIAAAACAPRQVEVRTAPNEQSAGSVQVNNTLAKAVNVYVTTGGTDTFLRQVAAKSQATIPLSQYVVSGSSVSLKAVTIDGVDTYTKPNVALTGTFVFALP
jgi:molybdopterin biosynthesis enzyme MoaB